MRTSRSTTFLMAALAAATLALTAPVFGTPTQQASQAALQGGGEHPDIRLFFQAASPDPDVAEPALEQLEGQWKDGYTPMLVEFLRFLSRGTIDRDQLGGGSQMIDPDTSMGGGVRGQAAEGRSRFANRRDPRVQARERLVAFLEDQTGQDFGGDMDAWRRWVWDNEFELHPGYGILKANLYGSFDERFRNFFRGESAVRLDEIDWGGVGVSGIPALDHPEVVPASEADYLDGGDVVFGITVDGEHRAYPKRILAWHELAWDEVGGTEITLVYCTLCGTAIPYKSEVGGRLVKFDTSGLLYRSNKLLYDDVSWTLWSSITGEPVVGPMVGSGVELSPLAAVTTSWSDWKSEHPDTTVLSLDTGFDRDYSEGAAYRDYFATDELMFAVPERDDRLANKAEVLAMRFDTSSGERALAIAADFLADNRVFQTQFAGRNLVVVTSPQGANRVYAAGANEFVRIDDSGKLVDAQGDTWDPRAELLVPEADPDAGLPRLPAFRAFWFGWYAQYPDTELIGA